MIQYDKDGVTVYYVDDKGNKISAVPFEGSRYSDLLTIMDAQAAATFENNHAVDIYKTALSNAQLNVNNGHADTVAPPKPLQHIVDDAGKSTYVPFNPPLADLIPLPAHNPAGDGQIAVPTVDKQAIMYSMITAIYRKMFPTG